jgi:hypothetical protein
MNGHLNQILIPHKLLECPQQKTVTSYAGFPPAHIYYKQGGVCQFIILFPWKPNVKLLC